MFPYQAPLHGILSVPGDKSISHRSIMIGSLAGGTTHISGFLSGEDCLSTISCFRRMGIEIEQNGSRVLVRGKGLHGLHPPKEELNCGNSGTTMRLISGILSAQDFSCILTGDDSLKKRPMDRIILPLSEMGADISGNAGNGFAPLRINGKPLHGIRFHSPVPSAQVKSCVLLAGLYADSETTVIEKTLSRDHTERMLSAFGADVSVRAEKECGGTKEENRSIITINPAGELISADIAVPGDISSAAYFIAASLMVPGSDILLKNVGINPTRNGILEIAGQMGAQIEVTDFSSGNKTEPSADLRIRYAPLHGIEIGGSMIPRLIDEIPMIAAMACTAEGTTVIRDASELKVKESNRIKVMVENLKQLGASAAETEDGMIIEGKNPLHGGSVDSHRDHRIAMTFSVLDLVTDGKVEINDTNCIDISYPGFYRDLNSLF